MQRRDLLRAVSIPLLGFVAPVAAPAQSVQASAGGMTAGAAYPPIGARWRVRVTDSGAMHSTVEDRDIAAAAVAFNGRPGYGIVGPRVTTVLDPATFNPIGTIEAGRVAVTDTPDTGLFSWPLWVGKTWETTYSHYDRLYGAAWGPAISRARVAGIEDVTVPAGTFQAFRIDYLGGIGSSIPGGFRSAQSPGFESRDTYWYAPGPKLIVKSEKIRSGSNYQWAARTVTELVSPPR
jgi:hypothetical protein